MDAKLSGKRTKRSNIRRISILISLLPAIGFGVHYYISNYYSAGYIEKVLFVHPSESYTEIDGTYQLTTETHKSAIDTFSRYYFDEYISNENYIDEDIIPLPLFYDRREDPLGIASSDFFLHSLIEDGEVRIPLKRIPNMAMFKVFVRNIRANNIINRLKVKMKKLKTNDFPWKELNVNSVVKFENSYTFDPLLFSPVTLTTVIEKAPISNLNISFVAYSNGIQIGKEYVQSISGLIEPRDSLQPDFGINTATDDGRRHLTYISSERFKRLTESKGFDDFLEATRQIDPNDIQSHYGCKNGGAVLFTHGPELARLLNLSKIDQLEIHYDYESLSGKKVVKSETLSTKYPIYIFEDGISISLESVVECLGDEKYTDILINSMETSAAGWVSSIDQLAVSLINQSTSAKSNIALESSFLFVLDTKQASFHGSVEQLKILQDGEFVQFNIWATAFEGGDYQISFYFDDELVDEMTINFLWPQRSKFRPEDLELFSNF
jgi:hypothetical protein